MELIPIEASGQPAGHNTELPDPAAEVCLAMEQVYKKTGFIEPWIGYLARQDGEWVGTCAFKSTPINNRVEIAYFTFPEFEGRGLATSMAFKLVALAKESPENPEITAQTLPERNASHRVLEKTGFRPIGVVDHPEDGPVLEWVWSANPGANEDGSS